MDRTVDEASESDYDGLVLPGGLVEADPDDLPAFCDKLAEEICEGRHEEQAASTR